LKTTTKLIRVKSDFDYGRANGLNYIAIVLQLATFIEVVKLDRIWYAILIPSGMILTWIWGMILRKINFRKRESSFINQENPEIMEIHKTIKK
jgi:hypothetical protein